MLPFLNADSGEARKKNFGKRRWLVEKKTAMDMKKYDEREKKRVKESKKKRISGKYGGTKRTEEL